MPRKQKGWTADIGTYEKGINITLKANNLSDAIAEANARLDESYDHCPVDQEPYVAQIYHDGRIVWDFMNLDTCYK